MHPRRRLMLKTRLAREKQATQAAALKAKAVEVTPVISAETPTPTPTVKKSLATKKAKKVVAVSK
jgi:hypothetical protein